MLKKPVTITFLALALAIPAAASPQPSDDPPDERVIVLPDEDSDIDMDIEMHDNEPMVVRLDRDHGRGFLGVRLIEMTPELREHFGVSPEAGVLVGGVEPDSPAAKAGVQVGDILTAADGDRIDSARDLSRAVRRKKTGETVKLDLSRNRSKKQLTVTVAERPAKDVRIAKISPRAGKRAWFFRDHEEMGRVEDRLEELEKRLKDLEKKLAPK